MAVNWQQPHTVAWPVFFAALAIYTSTGHKLGSGDAIPSALLPVLIVLHGTVHFDQFVPALKQQWDYQLPYFLAQTPHGVMPIYPVATGLLATPVLTIPILAIESVRSPDTLQWLDYAHLLGFWAAAAITAASAAIFWMICRSLESSLAFSLGLTAFYAFGSEAFCTSSQVLWQQGPGTLFALVALLCLIRFRQQPSHLWAIALSFAAGIDAAVRPTNFLLVGPLLAIAIYEYPRRLISLVLPCAAIGVVVVAYNFHYFGNLLGGYDAQLSKSGTSFTTSPQELAWNLMGMLFSPGRGLFIYFPFALVLLALVTTRPKAFLNLLSAALLFSTLSLLLFYSDFRSWTAGWSTGPRYLTEVQPFMLLPVGVAWRSFSTLGRRVLVLVCFCICLPYCIAVQSILTYSIEPLMWNKDYDGNINAVWYWRDNPIFRGLKQL